MKFYLLVLFVVSSLFSQQYPERISHRKSNFPYPKSEISGPVQSRQPNEYHSQYPPGEEWRQFSQPKEVTGNDATWETHILAQYGSPMARTADVIGDSLGNCYHIIEFQDPVYGGNIAIIKYGNDGTRLWEKYVENGVDDNEIAGLSQARIGKDLSIHLIYLVDKYEHYVGFSHIKYSANGDLLYDRDYEQIAKIYYNYNYNSKFKYSYLDGEGNFYFLKDSYGSEWYLMKFDKNCDFEKLYVFSNEGPFDHEIGLIGNNEEMPVVKVAYSDEIRYYQFNDSLSLKWYFSYSIGEYYWPSENVESLTIFDSNNNLFFFNKPEYPDKIVKVDRNGNLNREIKITDSNWDNALIANSNDEIVLLRNLSEGTLVSAFDSTGNMVYNQLNQCYTNLYNANPTADKNGNVALDRFVFDNECNLVFTGETRLKFSGKGLYNSESETFVDPHAISYGFNLLPSWADSWEAPFLNIFRSFSFCVDEFGYSYLLGTQSYGWQAEFEFIRLDPNGNREHHATFESGWNYVRVLRFDQVEKDRFICILGAYNSDEEGYPNQFANIVIFLDREGNVLSKRVYEMPEYQYIYAASVNKKKGSYYYFVSQFYDYDRENEIEYIYINFLIIDTRGNLVASNYVAYQNAFHSMGAIPGGTVIDAEGAIHLFTTLYYYYGTQTGRILRIYKLTLDNQLSHIDNSSLLQVDIHLSLYNTKQDNWGSLIIPANYYDGQSHMAVAKVSTKGDVLWETPLVTLKSADSYVVPETISGRILVFVRDYNANNTFLYVLNKDGQIELEKTFQNQYNNQKYFIKNDQIIFTDNSTIRIFDLNNYEYVEVMAQADNRGRKFNTNEIFVNPEGSVFLTGNRYISYNWFDVRDAGVIRFDTDTLNQNLDQQAKQIRINGNFPNPFNSQTAIRIFLPETGNMEIDVYNSLGQRVDTYSEYMPAGNQVYYFKNSVLSSGTYFYLVRQNGRKATGKFVYVK